MTKLTEADKTEIRREYGNNPNVSLADLAKRFGRGRSTIHRIIHTCDAVSSTAPSRKRARRETKRNTVPPEHLPVRQEQPRTAPLQTSARVEAEQIMGELLSLYKVQMSRLDELIIQEQEYKKTVAGDKLRDKLTIETFKSFGSPTVTRYKDLTAANKAVIDALLPKEKFDELWNVHSKMAISMGDLKRTLGQMADLAKNVVMYFDNRQVNVTATCARCSRPLKERLQEYEQLWVEESEANVIDVKATEESE